MQMKNDISEIISECLKIPGIQYKCTIGKNMSFEEMETAKKDLSRVLGYCILLRSNDGIEEYMNIKDKRSQISFLKNKIAMILGIPPEKINERMPEIIGYAYENFQKNGFVFHSANSLSIEEKMKTGLKAENTNKEQMDELQEIANIYRKYGCNCPLGWAMSDIKYKKNGWFYDGFPANIYYYANSPEWFNQFCGENNAYYGIVPNEMRHGYQNRDYDTIIETITSLMEKIKMNEEDKEKVMQFFNNKWRILKDTKPGVILVPISQINSNIDHERAMSFFIQYPDQIFKKAIECKSEIDLDKCCKQDVAPEYLKSVDLTSVFPRFKIERDAEIEDKKNSLFNLIQSGILTGKLSSKDLELGQKFFNELMNGRMEESKDG